MNLLAVFSVLFFGSGCGCLGGDFSGEVVFSLLQAFADDIQAEPGNLR
jgi:hypothetical protein